MYDQTQDATPELGADEAAGARELGDPDRAAELGHHLVHIGLHVRRNTLLQETRRRVSAYCGGDMKVKLRMLDGP